jgi:hypothetical protein
MSSRIGRRRTRDTKSLRTWHQLRDGRKIARSSDRPEVVARNLLRLFELLDPLLDVGFRHRLAVHLYFPPIFVDDHFDKLP